MLTNLRQCRIPKARGSRIATWDVVVLNLPQNYRECIYTSAIVGSCLVLQQHSWQYQFLFDISPETVKRSAFSNSLRTFFLKRSTLGNWQLGSSIPFCIIFSGENIVIYTQAIDSHQFSRHQACGYFKAFSPFKSLRLVTFSKSCYRSLDPKGCAPSINRLTTWTHAIIGIVSYSSVFHLNSWWFFSFAFIKAILQPYGLLKYARWGI